MCSLILFLVFLVPWLLVGSLAYDAVYVGMSGRDKELTVALAIGCALAAMFLAMPTTMMVMAALDPKNDKDKK